MITFDPENPFPLLAPGAYTYAEAKEHAKQVDTWLGFQIDEIESRINKIPDQENWQHLDSQAFQTPYLEIRTMLDLLQSSPGDRVIDLGCGYGRMAHVIGKHHPELKFIGYELESLRVAEAARVLAKFQYLWVEIHCLDLKLQTPPVAQTYFIYDYGTNAAIEKTLQDLKAISSHTPFQVIARGRASRSLIHKGHAWLCEVNAPRHFETFSIYQS